MADLTTYTVAVSAVISAAPRACYDTIADYRAGHPKIVPPKWFGPIIVDTGGVGAGTRIHFAMTVFGQTRTLRAEVTEPVPGRVLVESYPETGVVTTFTVVEASAGAARVTIETRTPRGKGLRAAAERAVTRRVLPGIFVAELRMLAAHVGGEITGMPETVRVG
jgi:Polyketide cyclase / dehydrase and lipid transport.